MANTNSLKILIQQINEQKGQFRNITEDSLEEEIRAFKSGDGLLDTQADENQEEGEDGEHKQERKEMILAARQDILNQVGNAYMEAYYALDFVSLLLSKETPRQAELSMSQELKQHVPLGSIGVGRVQAQPESTEIIKDQDLVLKGWRLQSLNSAADALIKSAAKLESEIQQEVHYWEQILAIDGKSWSLCRMPKERHTLGVRFGFLEAAAEFRDRGLAALRRGEEGTVVLDQGLLNSTPKAIRVRTESNNNSTTSSSALPSIAAPGVLVEELILQARNSIYEEELHYELMREARILTNQGVRIKDSTIVLALPDQQILVDLVPLEAEPSSSSHSTNTDNSLAESIALAFRLLLSHAHRQNHLRRAQIPPPLTERKRPIPPYSIIRPILTHLHHRTATLSLRGFLKTLLASIRLAGLPAGATLSHAENCILPSTALSSSGKAEKTPMETIINTLSNAIESIFELNLPAQATISIRVRTLLYPPVFGTEYHITGDPEPARPGQGSISNNSKTSNIRFSSEEELKRYLHYVTTLSLISQITTYAPPPISTAEMAMKKALPAPPEPFSTKEHIWTRSSSFNELTMNYPKTGRTKRLRVQMTDAGIELQWGWMNGKQTGKGHGRFTWDVVAGAAAGSMTSFRDVVREASRYV